MAYSRSYIGQDDYGLGQMSTGAQVGIKVASTAMNFIPVVGSVLSGITNLIASIFGGGEPSRHMKSDAAIEASKKYMPRDLPDMIRRIELFLKSLPPKTCHMPNFGGGPTSISDPKEGRAQYVAACLTAMKLDPRLRQEWRSCSPYDDQLCPHLKRIREVFIAALPELKAGRLPGATAEQNAATSSLASLGGEVNWLPLILLGGGIYWIARR